MSALQGFLNRLGGRGELEILGRIIHVAGQNFYWVVGM